jgi:NAD dependent epimerase/dehydratase family enzyme
MIHNVPVSASTTGYYGDGVDEMLTEESQSSVGFFLLDVCRNWEEATHLELW